MSIVLNIVQIVISVVLLALILIQNKGVGLSGTFGGGGEVYFARRGAEKIVFVFTILAAVAFIGASIASVVLA
ncbi:preprotein translocase subunit SecG [candidate division WWE3 bacterium]|uniref:Protein-export membrane protein SecG n=1 Tax=candidate division WWE3 bacterium TaxID=2053526 RepID=A0A955LKC3_UNCKA|nr:preprotein translocase subunit SecG [candidate division WWE3 bacterium]